MQGILALDQERLFLLIQRTMRNYMSLGDILLKSMLLKINTFFVFFLVKFYYNKSRVYY